MRILRSLFQYRFVLGGSIGNVPMTLGLLAVNALEDGVGRSYLSACLLG